MNLFYDYEVDKSPIIPVNPDDYLMVTSFDDLIDRLNHEQSEESILANVTYETAELFWEEIQRRKSA